MKIAKRIVALGTASKQREFFHAPRDVGEVEVACAFAVGQIAAGVYYGLACDIADPIRQPVHVFREVGGIACGCLYLEKMKLSPFKPSAISMCNFKIADVRDRMGRGGAIVAGGCACLPASAVSPCAGREGWFWG